MRTLHRHSVFVYFPDETINRHTVTPDKVTLLLAQFMSFASVLKLGLSMQAR